MLDGAEVEMQHGLVGIAFDRLAPQFLGASRIAPIDHAYSQEMQDVRPVAIAAMGGPEVGFRAVEPPGVQELQPALQVGIGLRGRHRHGRCVDPAPGQG